MSPLTDSELSSIRRKFLRGIAKVNLDALKFSHPLVQKKHRATSHKNISRLENIFKQKGCLRLQSENFIRAVIDDSTLETSLELAGISPDEFRYLQEGDELPHLTLQSVQCLSGLHRTEAAKNFLDPNDQWWIVKFYSVEMLSPPYEAASREIEAYGHEQRPSDGEIFRKIRLYHLSGDKEAEDRWWAHLDKSKPKDLRQLMKNPQIMSAFDALVKLPGIWDKIQLGALHRLLAMKCDEEMLALLKLVERAWAHILRCGNNDLSPLVVDPATSGNLELLAPCVSLSDKESITDMMSGKDVPTDKEIFTLIKDQNVRQSLLTNLCSLPCMIPTLGTFFETLKYLEPCCEALKQLIGPKDKWRGTIRASLMSYYFAPEKVMVQTSECYEAEYIKEITPGNAAQLAYMELWAFCARSFDSLTSFTPKKEAGESKPSIKGPNPVMLQYLARFALARGFRTKQALKLASHDARTPLALEYLHKANPMPTVFDDEQIKCVISTGMRPRDYAPSRPKESSYLNRERRCGRPFQRDYMNDKASLFLPNIYGNSSHSEVTLDFVRRNLFKELFGSFELQPSDLSPGQSIASWLHFESSIEPAQKEVDTNVNRLAELANENNGLRQELMNLTTMGRNKLQEMQVQYETECENLRQQATLEMSRLQQTITEQNVKIRKLDKKNKKLQQEKTESMQSHIKAIKSRSNITKPSTKSLTKAKRIPEAVQRGEGDPEEPQIPEVAQNLIGKGDAIPLEVVNSIVGSLQANQDFFSAALQLYGAPFTPQFLRNSRTSNEIVLIPGREGNSLGIRIALPGTESTSITLIDGLLKQLERFELNTGSQKRIQCAGSWQWVNKNTYEIWGACSQYEICFIGSESDLYDWNEASEGFIGTIPPESGEALIEKLYEIEDMEYEDD